MIFLYVGNGLSTATLLGQVGLESGWKRKWTVHDVRG